MKKFSSLLVVLLLMLASFTAGVEYQRGDVDQDGQVGISDVTCLIDYLLSGTWPDEPVVPHGDHEWVDLGLPSGTLWATCNVGASAPEEYGDHFAWGETEPKEVYSRETYKWHQEGYYDANGNWHQGGLTKYCTSSSYGYNGFVDHKTELEPEDDAAYVNWGPSWRMPTTEQQRELCEKCSSIWTTFNGVGGRLVIGPNGNSMFLPAAGCRWDESWHDAGSVGYYWSRPLYTKTISAYYHYFDLGNWGNWSSHELRYYGHAVRAVCVPQN